MEIILWSLLSGTLTAVLSGIYLKMARHYDLVDQPNERSSHTIATPRGGGVAIALAIGCGYGIFGFGVGLFEPELLWLILCAAMAGATGLLDDIFDLAVFVRLSAYLFASVLLLLLISPIPAGDMFPEWLAILISCLGLIWLLNLYNFMDGIDGIAAAEASTVCLSISMLLHINSAEPEFVVFAALIGGSTLGFLVWNWAPAKLFMGDVGSVFLGFIMGGFALLTIKFGAISLSVWLILLALFVSDASYTLIWRLSKRQNVFNAHRYHTYQRLARYWKSHAKPVKLYTAINLIWLLPLAYTANTYPPWSPVIVLLAYMPLLLMMAKLSDLA